MLATERDAAFQGNLLGVLLFITVSTIEDQDSIYMMASSTR